MRGGGGPITNDVLKMKKVIDFQSSWIVIYYNSDVHALLQSICASEVSIVIVLDKQYSLIVLDK